MVCAICGSDSGKSHVFREMKYGTHLPFDYWECLACGCIQIAEIPENMAEHYRDDYYVSELRFGALEPWMYRAYRYAPRLGELLRPAPDAFQAVLEAAPRPGDRILDVGCGGGKLVAMLRHIGWDAHGIDPYVTTETPYIRRAYLHETPVADWDLIMFHHSLEHMAGHVDVLRAARERLAPGGTCLIRIPIANWAWKHYKDHWAQLDPPRHFVIQSPQSFRLASEAAGFEIARVIYDSGPFQFYASELYQRNLPLSESSAEIARRGRSGMRTLRARASELNQHRLGDQAAFFLKAVPAR